MILKVKGGKKFREKKRTIVIVEGRKLDLLGHDPTARPIELARLCVTCELWPCGL